MLQRIGHNHAMTTAYATYCSAPKREDPGLLPAVERYRSARIAEIDRLATESGARFLILSGSFGLLDRHTPIPWYDHLLSPDEIPEMASRAEDWLRLEGISQIVWYSVDPAIDPNVTRYATVLELATEALQIPFRFERVEADD